MNPAVEDAISQQLMKPGPFTDAELDSVDALSVLRPESLDGIERLTQLVVLIVTGYGGRDLGMLDGPRLDTLRVRVSAVRDLAVVARLPQLRTLEVTNCAVEEIDVLTGPGHIIDELDLTGNPLSDRAFTEVLPALRERVSRQFRHSGEREWRLTRRLYAAGLPFDYYRDDRGYKLCRPGLEYTDYPNADHLTIEPDELERHLDSDPARIPALFPVYDD